MRAVLLFRYGRENGLQLHPLFRLAAQHYRRLGAGAGSPEAPLKRGSSALRGLSSDRARVLVGAARARGWSLASGFAPGSDLTAERVPG